MHAVRRKLIEVALPLEAINAASAREKSIRHGHPSTLHLWWARRPLAACRAVLFAQLVDDPSAWPDLFPTEEAQNRERQRLFALIEELVQWENSNNERVIGAARLEIARSIARGRKADGLADARDEAVLRIEPPVRNPLSPHNAQAVATFLAEVAPPVHDPFAGGGSIPLEAQRLGLRAIATDLNPVAVLINKALIEIPPKFAGLPPVNPESRSQHLGARASSPQQPTPQQPTPQQPSPQQPSSSSRPHLGWHSRGYLPHFDQPGLVQSITFRLHDSLPADVIEQWRQEIGASPECPADDPRSVELRMRIEAFEDSGAGACWLKDDRIARIVEQALLHFDGARYRLLAWCVMPNHVHVVIETHQGFPLGEVVHSWKSFTANQANKVLGRTGPFWMADYYDRFVRDERHFLAVVRYVTENPVKAGLVSDASQWRWSSAYKGEEEEEAARMAALPGTWKGARGLAEDVRYYGRWMRDEAFRRIGHLYPPVRVTEEMAARRPDLKEYVGNDLTVIAWLWARTVASPNPACGGVHVPLVSSFWLSKKPGKEAWVEPVVDRPTNHWSFEVRVGKPADPKSVDAGTKTGRGDFRCLLTGDPIPADYIRKEGQAGRIRDRLLAIVAEGQRGRAYIAPLPEHEQAARVAVPEGAPDTDLPAQALGFRVQNYGMLKHRDLFTPRQLTALVTFSDLVAEAREKAVADARETGMPPSDALEKRGNGAWAYGDAVAVYLSAAISRSADKWASLVIWNNIGEKAEHVFGRNALAMVNDFAEVNVFSGSTGNWMSAIEWVAEAADSTPADSQGSADQGDATDPGLTLPCLTSSDPPYYDNVPYADLSDFFYVWLRRSLQPVLPTLFRTMLVPKALELIAEPFRHGGKEAAEAFFMEGMTKAIRRMREALPDEFPAAIYYAFKQAETTEEATSSTGWETFLQAVIEAGFSIGGTWPVRTERPGRLRETGSNALASSIVLVCRKRPDDAPTITRADFRRLLRTELPAALKALQRGNIAPVDMAQASIGPGMAIFSRHSRVLEADGTHMTVRTALQLINQALDEYLTEQEGEFDGDTRFALTWFETRAYETGPFGEAEVLAKARNVSVAGVAEAGILHSAAGKVRLLRRDELPDDWDPEDDRRLTVWEAAQHLIKRLETRGEQAAAELLAHLRAKATPARDLAYRLYTTCERKGWAEEARSYNGLVVAWPELEKLAGRAIVQTPRQGDLL